MPVQCQEIDNLDQNQLYQDVIKEYQSQKDILGHEIPFFFESEKVGEKVQSTQMQLNNADQISLFVLYESTSTATSESKLSSSIEPGILDELEKHQNNRFYDFNQHRIPSKLQTAFVAGVKVHRQNLPPEPANYRQLTGHSFKKQF